MWWPHGWLAGPAAASTACTHARVQVRLPLINEEPVTSNSPYYERETRGGVKITLDWQAVVLPCLKWRDNGGRPIGQDKRISSQKVAGVDHAAQAPSAYATRSLVLTACVE